MSNTKFSQKRTLIKNELESIDHFLKNILSDSQLKNSNDVIELQIKRLKLLDMLRFLRPCKTNDITYRKNVFDTFPFWGTENIPEEMRLVFHGTTLANTERILNSKRIISGKDRWSIHTSGDEAGEFSVSTKDFLEISMHYHMDLVETYKDYEWFVPAGCLLVLQLDEKEFQFAKEQQRAHNIQLRRNPQQLYSVITTPENINRVKWWMQKNDFPPIKVVDFKGFKEKINQENLYFYLINHSKQK